MIELTDTTLVEAAIDRIREATDGVIEGVTWIKPKKRWMCRLHTGWVGIEENEGIYLPILKWKDTRTQDIRDDLLELASEKNLPRVNLLALAAIEEFRRELEAIPGATRRFAGEQAADPVVRRLRYAVEFPASAVDEPETIEIIVNALRSLAERTRRQE